MQFSQAYDPIRSLQVAWKLLKQAPVMVLVGGLLLAFLEGGGSGGFRYNFGHTDIGRAGNAGEAMRQMFEDIKPWLVFLIPIAICVGLAFFALSSWIEVGFARAIELALRTGKDDIGKVFSGGDRFGAMLLARFLSGLIQFACMLPFAGVVFGAFLLSDRGDPSALGILALVAFALLWFVVVLYITLGLYLVNPVVAFESCNPTEALARSWRLASGHRLQLFWFILLQVFVAIAGFCACCIGLLVALPLTHVMRFEAYVALTKGGEYPQWWVGTGRFPFDEHKSQDFSSPQQPPPTPPPLPPQT